MPAKLAPSTIPREVNESPRHGESFRDYLVREDAELQAQVQRQMAFLEGADFADLHDVLSMVLGLLDTGDNPRVVAGVKTISRLLGHDREPGSIHLS